jgi:hypothetical protein
MGGDTIRAVMLIKDALRKKKEGEDAANKKN